MTRRSRARTTEQLVTLFWLQIDIGAADACWLWRGYSEKGYGKFYAGGKMRPAHDLALEWHSGEGRPQGMDTCHNCNVPLCCNPHHLRYDTRQSNVADMLAAGTHVVRRKLSDDDVRHIRERAASGATGRLLARQYGVSESLVTEIIRGNKRTSAGGPIRSKHGNKKEKVYP